MSLDDKFGPLRKGLLEFVVLKIVQARQVYAADILATLNQTDFTTGEGTLYPLLSRLKRDGLLHYSWVESEVGPPRKYYSLTKTGADRLRELQKYWNDLTTTLQTIGEKKS
ncbi:MAG TPA: PadR family transcriptional regulator [Candidatus Saccharimonadales bacterium]|nr:PadR family transcriptional regulator [Candidatus Saccharimonadales bacterium]